MELSKTGAFSLPDGQRAELIDGQIYYMAPSKRIHQRLIHQLEKLIGNHIDARDGDCEVYPAPFAVFLNADDKNYVEPDNTILTITLHHVFIKI